MSTTIQSLDQRDAQERQLDSLRMRHRAAQSGVRSKSAALKIAEIAHSDLVVAVAALQKVTRAFATIPPAALARLRSGGSSDPLTPAIRIVGPSLRDAIDSTAEHARAQLAEAAQVVTKLREELAQAEESLSTIGARVDELAKLAAT